MGVHSGPVVEDNWQERAVWVQDIVMLRVLEKLDQDAVLVQLQTGEQCVVSAQMLEDEYHTFYQDGVFKPVFNPLRAICFDHEARVLTGQGPLTVPIGDAVLERADGSVAVLQRQTFNLRYRIVGHAAEKPIAPFVQRQNLHAMQVEIIYS